VMKRVTGSKQQERSDKGKVRQQQLLVKRLHGRDSTEYYRIDTTSGEDGQFETDAFAGVKAEEEQVKRVRRFRSRTSLVPALLRKEDAGRLEITGSRELHSRRSLLFQEPK
jgi:hypothetical protein